MNRFRRTLVVLMAVVQLIILAYRGDAAAPGPRVSEYRAAPGYNRHNLSAKAWGLSGLTTNVNPYRATDDAVNNPGGQQICIFCHTPHNASSQSPAPLWNRNLSTQTFSRYSSATLQIRVNPTTSSLAQYGSGAQPDGSSRLCLSCHDGVSTAGLGTVLRGGNITMATGYGYIPTTSRASFNPSTNKMKFGHHPVSFVYTGGIANSVQYRISTARPGQGFRLPSQSLYASQVKLDKNNKMQCTTCHNAHQNQSDDDWCYWSAGGPGSCTNALSTGRKMVPFWVLHSGTNTASQDHDAVCTSCHNMTQGNSPAVPWPWP